MSATTPSVCLVLLNWNSWKDSIECLESIQRLEYSNYTVVLVDNLSTDDSLTQIHAWAKGELPVESKYLTYNREKKPVTVVEYSRAVAEAGGKLEDETLLNQTTSERKLVLIQSGANLGFAEGCNVGIRYALRKNFEVVCLLNNDTVTQPDALIHLVAHFKEPKVGIVGGKILYYHEPEYIWYGGGHVSLMGRGPGYMFEGINQKDSPEWNQAREVSFVTGCVMAIHSRVLESIGIIDGRFFFGAEDADFCLRATRTGFKIIYDPKAVIYHRVARTYNKFSEKHVYYVYRGKFIFMRKHLPAFLWWLWVTAFMVYALTFAPAKRALSQRSLDDGLQLFKAARRAFRDAVESFDNPKTLIQ